MRNNKASPVVETPSAYTIGNALVALELEKTDDTVLRYMKYMARKIPIGCSCFMHILPQENIEEALLEKDIDPLVEDFQIAGDVEKKMREELDTLFEGSNEILVRFKIAEGYPLDELLEASHQKDASHIVIGQKKVAERHGILAKRLARRSTADVLIIPEDAPARISCILVPTDFSENSARALKSALALRQQLGGNIAVSCVHVVNIPDMNAHRFIHFPDEVNEPSVKERHRDRLNSFVEKNVPVWKSEVQVVIINRGERGIARALLDFAKQDGSDLIVIGSHGHSSLERLFLGSVTELLLDQNDIIPTLIVR